MYTVQLFATENLKKKKKKEKPLKADILLKSRCGISTQAESELTYKFYIWS